MLLVYLISKSSCFLCRTCSLTVWLLAIVPVAGFPIELLASLIHKVENFYWPVCWISIIFPVCSLRLLPFLWQMELSKRLKMTQFSCVGVESNEARSLCGLTAAVQGHNRSSDPTQRMEQTLSQQLTNFSHWSRRILGKFNFSSQACRALNAAVSLLL